MCADPCSISSRPANGFEMLSDSVVRLSQPSFSGLSVSVAAAVAVHGPSHEFRPAMVPSWLIKQFFTRDDADDKSLLIPCATVGSAALALNTKALSLDSPSPLTSPATT